MQHAAERVERPGESQEALDGKKDSVLVRTEQKRSQIWSRTFLSFALL